MRKYDFDGNGVWTRQFGTAGFDSAHGILAHRVGPDDVRVYVVGGAGPLSGQTYAGGSTDAFLRLYDGDGNEVWTRQFGSSAGDLAWDVSLQRGRLYLAGDAGAPARRPSRFSRELAGSLPCSAAFARQGAARVRALARARVGAWPDLGPD